ncbi:MAG: phosphoribosylanthranilate isomerase [Planctomycetes bacterium]|nr:phosphoribosylanthranilate isomerase [Planctomycetota bacterium]
MEAPRSDGNLVKICGITRAEDAHVACAAGADALGFVFWPRSPRVVTPERVRTIGAGLPRRVLKVGVFVDASAAEIRAVAAAAGLDRVQLHGAESPEFAVALGLPCWKALRVRGDEARAEVARFRPVVEHVLLDAYVEGAVGGTGRTFNWEIAARAAADGPILLAGGLTPENVAAALTRVHPAGVDVSSGVESAPGIKDAAKVRAFIDEVRKWESRIAAGTSGNSAGSSSPKP